MAGFAWGGQGGGGVPTIPNTPTAPPVPFQSKGQTDAGNTFSAVGQGAIDWTNYAGGEMGKTANAADQAYAQYMNKNPSANLSSYSPTQLNSYSPASLQTWLNNANLGPAKLGQVATASAGTSSYSPSDLKDFDPSAAMATYAQGAESAFNTNLKEQLRQLTNKSVGAGRINTGVFDEDTGRVVNQNARDYSSAIAGQATALSGQKLSALTSMDQILAAQAEANAGNATSASIANAGNSVTARGQDVSAYAAETGRMGLAEGAASDIAKLGLERATSLDTLGLSRAGQEDTLGLEQMTAGLNTATSRANTAATNYATAESAASGYASANLAHQDQAKLESDLIAWMTKMGLGPYGQTNAKGTPGGNTKAPSGPGPMEQLALSLGVPYSGPPGG